MPLETTRLHLALVQCISLSRALSGLIFACLALLPDYSGIALAIFSVGTLSDFLDGYLARKWNCSTEIGGALDVFGDKALTISSLMYVVARGFNMLPCLLFTVREILLLSVRSVQVEGRPIIPLTGKLGGATLVPIRSITFLLLVHPTLSSQQQLVASVMLWAGSAFSLGSLSYSVSKNWSRVLNAFKA